MDNQIRQTSNKDKVAIIVVGYNRLPAIKRLLKSLVDAHYEVEDVPLVISIDCSGNQQLYDYVIQFNWPHGEKYVNIQKERLGLKNHIYQCFDYSQFFRAVVLLEDDVFVAKSFFKYIISALDTYEHEDRVAEIALYKDEMNGYVGLPFIPIDNGSDTYLLQDVCTSGECVTWNMWKGFKEWVSKNPDESFKDVDMPVRIKQWKRAWSKAYNAYVVSSEKYVVYPHTAVTTNFNDMGEHGGDGDAVAQVCLSQRENNYYMLPFEELIKYDIYFNNVDLYRWLDIPSEKIVLDVYGYNERIFKDYLLSLRVLPYKVVKSYSLSMRPIELNVKYNIMGKGLFLYDTSSVKGLSVKGKINEGILPYYFEGYNHKLLLKHILRTYYRILLNKMRLK